MNNYVMCSGKINSVPQTHLFITDSWGVNDLKQLTYFGIKNVINVSPGAVITEHPGITFRRVDSFHVRRCVDRFS